ncbi:MAG TPA: Hsp70 family protein [Pseudonocardiaceae bacterium]|nr:Hsp70 family protein [Pseudonocardiaceae bacterium]
MSYWLGIDVGTTYTAAAVCREEAGRRVLPEVIPLGSRSTAVSSVVYLGEDGHVVVGEAAERRVVTNPERVVRQFKRRIGDDVPMIIDGVPYSAPQITAMVIRWVVDRVAAREGSAASGIVITHPAGWGAYKIQVVADALRAADLAEVMFRTEPEAAAASYASQERVDTGSTIAVYDFGGGTFDAAVVRKSGATTFSVLGIPQGIERLGGVDFDDAVFDHVTSAVPAIRELDPEDPATLAATAALRRQCTEAKEALSVDTEVTIPVLAPGIQTQVRLVRAEFEEMIRPQVAETVDALRRALRSADVSPEDLDAVLLVGGSSRVPLVTQLVSAELGRPVAVDADPKAAIALGAALSALPPGMTGAEDTPKAVVPAPAAASVPSGIPAPAPPQIPQRPSLSAVPLEIGTAQSRWEPIGINRGAVAALVALVVAGGGAAALLLSSHSSSTPQASTGTTAPAPASSLTTTPAPGTGNGASPNQGGNDPVRLPVVSAPNHENGASAPARAAVLPTSQTASATTENGITSRPAPTSAPPTPAATTTTTTKTTTTTAAATTTTTRSHTTTAAASTTPSH